MQVWGDKYKINRKNKQQENSLTHRRIYRNGLENPYGQDELSGYYKAVPRYIQTLET